MNSGELAPLFYGFAAAWLGVCIWAVALIRSAKRSADRLRKFSAEQ